VFAVPTKLHLPVPVSQGTETGYPVYRLVSAKLRFSLVRMFSVCQCPACTSVCACPGWQRMRGSTVT